MHTWSHLQELGHEGRLRPRRSGGSLNGLQERLYYTMCIWQGSTCMKSSSSSSCGPEGKQGQRAARGPCGEASAPSFQNIPQSWLNSKQSKPFYFSK